MNLAQSVDHDLPFTCDEARARFVELARKCLAEGELLPGAGRYGLSDRTMRLLLVEPLRLMEEKDAHQD